MAQYDEDNDDDDYLDSLSVILLCNNWLQTKNKVFNRRMTFFKIVPSGFSLDEYKWKLSGGILQN